MTEYATNPAPKHSRAVGHMMWLRGGPVVRCPRLIQLETFGFAKQLDFLRRHIV